MNQSALAQTIGPPLGKSNGLAKGFFGLEETSRKRSLVQKILVTAATWHRRQDQRRQLSLLDLRQLNDMGISHEDRNREAAKAFWEK